MQGVRFQRLALRRLGYPAERTRPECVYADRQEHDTGRPPCRLDLDMGREEPLYRLVDDPQAGQEEKGGFAQRRDALDLGVSVRMLLVGRRIAYPYREVGQQRRAQVEQAVRRLGEDADAAGEQT